MSPQAESVRKLSETFNALEGFFASVNSHMTDEITFFITGIRTCFTRPVCLFFVKNLFMYFEFVLLF